eukprot:PhF_6_TR19972/c1_g1_i1/m.29125/K06693/PSMD9; 26S proteasome non-ATPase regulatory subunit 9
MSQIDELKKKLNELGEQRSTLEKELLFQTEYLNTTPAGLHGPLKDPEGFPRADCDIHAIMIARNRVSVLTTDLRIIMSAMEEALHEFHNIGVLIPGKPNAAPKKVVQVEEEVQQPPPAPAPTPLCRVNQVDGGSPAAEAGLCVGDVVMKYGDVLQDHLTQSADALQRIGAFTMRNVGNTFAVSVLRGGEVVVLNLTPRTWSGRGVLGCHLLPV